MATVNVNEYAKVYIDGIECPGIESVSYEYHDEPAPKRKAPAPESRTCSASFEFEVPRAKWDEMIEMFRPDPAEWRAWRNTIPRIQRIELALLSLAAWAEERPPTRAERIKWRRLVRKRRRLVALQKRRTGHGQA